MQQFNYSNHFSRSNKLKPFWLSITEKESLPVLDFLSAALLSAEYDRALSRAAGMAECRVVPFFGAFLRELGDILSSTPAVVTLEHVAQEAPFMHSQTQTSMQAPYGSSNNPGISGTSKQRERDREQGQQHRQVVRFISFH